MPATDPPRCRWPKGCMCQPSLLVYEGARDGLCFYHWKVKTGLIDPREVALAGRKVISDSEVVSDAQAEVAHILRKLGAEPQVVERALRKESPDGRSARSAVR